MRLIKLAVISAIVLFGIITLIAMLIPSQVRISRAVDIAGPREKILRQLVTPAEWEKWNEYIKSYHHRQAVMDAISSDEMTVTLNGISDTLVGTIWQKPGGDSFTSGYALISHDSTHHTVQWYFDFHLRWYPWEKFQSIVYDQQFGPVMEKSLLNIKRTTENSQ
jgi:hypothetical protein